jgi:hypothetical protein
MRLNVYRGHVISLSPGMMGIGPQTLVAFHSLPRVERSDGVLPDEILEPIVRQTVVFAQHAEQLLAAGRSLKRGLLLFGPPGTGKTLTIMYLVGQMQERTVILTTGRGMGMLQSVAQMARTLQPALVVLDDVDLIAQERGQPFQQTGPLLFELLNEMDGLSDDCDVIFVLTTQSRRHPRASPGGAARSYRPRARAADARRTQPPSAVPPVRSWPRGASRRPGCPCDAHRGRQPGVYQGAASQSGRAGRRAGPWRAA